MTTSSFSFTQTEQVEYTMYPPTLQQSMAAKTNSFSKWAEILISLKHLDYLIDGSLQIIPVPEHGASNKTLSKFFITLGNFLPS